MARVIGIISSKGGVGKTTIAVNMATLLHQNKYENILVETNFTSPTAGLQLGLVPAEHTIDKVANKRMKIRDVLIEHPSGLTMVSFSMVLRELKDMDPENLMKVVRRLKKESELIILDGPNGLGRDTVLTIENSDDIIIVTNPELPAVVEALRSARLSKALKKRVLGIVINRVGDYEYELLPEEIENLVEERILAIIPEDPVLQEGIAHRTPVVVFDSGAPSAVALRELTQDIIGISLEMPAEKKLGLEKLSGVAPKKAHKKKDMDFIASIKDSFENDINVNFRGILNKLKVGKTAHAEGAEKPAKGPETIKKPAIRKEDALRELTGEKDEKITQDVKGISGRISHIFDSKGKAEKAEPKTNKKNEKQIADVSAQAAAPPKEKKRGIADKFIEFLHTDYDLKTMKAKK